ncbi:expressed unknown protein [Seminavis robusta]|uniref:Uncharacterized protein n=1 Tax=Seminavis robusta TaxID=568900 RepID=A0A9N8DCA6_9STRA|nr:expressed unknown protein [Seminavis robusta]|eukprot:Sro14_g010440.1 n/a (519) ;mRNA; f:33957-35513
MSPLWWLLTAALIVMTTAATGEQDERVLSSSHSYNPLDVIPNVFLPRDPVRADPLPMATFTLRLGFANQVFTAPSVTDTVALVCQMNRHVQQRLRNQTQDPLLESQLEQIAFSSELDANNLLPTWELQFQVTATFGYNGKTISPWTIVRVLDLAPDDIRFLLREYVRPLVDTVFPQTQTLVLESQLQSTPDNNNATTTTVVWDTMPQVCPPPPSPVSNIFGRLTAVPGRAIENERQGVFDSTLTTPPKDGGMTLNDHSRARNNPNNNTPLSDTLFQRNHRVAVTLSFWVANNQGITNATWISSEWMEPSFSRLVDLAVAVTTTTASLAATVPRVVPHSATIVDVTPSKCPLLDEAWHCHKVVGQYEMTVQQVGIPLPVDPARYTHAMRRAIQMGVYEQDILQQDGVRVANELEGLLPVLLDDDTTIDVNNNNDSISGVETKHDMAAIVIPVIIVLALVLLAVLVYLRLRVRRKLQLLQRQRETALWEMEAFLLPPSSPLEEYLEPSRKHNGLEWEETV